jgi:hypothetical protein
MKSGATKEKDTTTPNGVESDEKKLLLIFIQPHSGLL